MYMYIGSSESFNHKSYSKFLSSFAVDFNALLRFNSCLYNRLVLPVCMEVSVRWFHFMHCADAFTLYIQLNDRNFFLWSNQFTEIYCCRVWWLICAVIWFSLFWDEGEKNEYERTKMVVISSFRLRLKKSPLNDEKEENYLLLVLLSRK